MIKAYSRMIRPVIALSIFLFAIHFALIEKVLPDIYRESKYWLLYLFIVPLTLLAMYFIFRSYLKDAKSVGKSFLAYVIIKMILVIAFLSPWLFFKDDFTMPFVYQFLLMFFPFLLLETIILVNLVNGKYDR